MDKYQNWLAQLPNIGNNKKIKLVRILGSAKKIYYAKEETLRKIEDESKYLVTDKNLQALYDQEIRKHMEENFVRLNEIGIRGITFEDRKYPVRLANIPDPPYQLFYFGELPFEKKPALAIIGARECTSYGQYMAKEIGKILGRNGIEVISGMAKGIDGISQRAALQEGGRSFAVLGSGVDVCYPRENMELYEMLKKRGGVLSEYVPRTKPRKGLFPPRNRIISGLSDGVIVVEARRKSGTRITVEMALEQGKDVYVVPGRITDGLSEGCNQLIKEGAEVIASISDFMKEFLAGKPFVDEIEKADKGKSLTIEERKVYNCIDYYPKNINEIAEELGDEESVSEIMKILLSLEIKKYIVRIAMNSYVLRDSKIT